MALPLLTMRQMLAIQAIYETGQISAAAEQLSVSQSAVSVLLGQAEAALDARLFDRTTRRVVPTQAVEQIIGIVGRVLDDASSIGSVMTDLKELERGVVRIAATPATGIALLPDPIRKFKAMYPRIQIVMNDCAPDQFLSLVREEKVDVGVGIPPSDRTEFDWRVLHHDPISFVCHREHPLAERGFVGWKELDGVPLIMSRRNYGVRGLVEDAIRAAGGVPVLASEVGFLYSAEWMVACKFGSAAFPSRLASAVTDPTLRVLPIREPVVTRTLAVISRRGRSLSPSAQKFTELLVRELG